jgi:cyclopropane-fatty-acyl-phospholipid synthase
MMKDHCEKAGFTVDEPMSLRSHYVKTLGLSADALEANKSAAVTIQSEDVYDNYMKYLRGCQEKFADEYIDVLLVTTSRAPPRSFFGQAAALPESASFLS